ncbi:MAG: WGR domain-containing protein [Anaerolineales bacterium]
MIILHRVDPSKCVYRWYTVDVQPTLIDPWPVICAWGSLRSNFQQQRSIPCGSREDAERLALQIVTRKLKKGYTIIQPVLEIK